MGIKKFFLTLFISLTLIAPCLSDEVYFSPNGGVATHIIEAINNADKTIDLAIFDFTSNEIKDALLEAKERGIKIRIIAEKRQSRGLRSIIPILVKEGFDIKIMRGKGGGIMHNKFAIIDGSLLITGSYNWTNNAEKFNYENTVFLSSLEIIGQYQKEFEVMEGE